MDKTTYIRSGAQRWLFSSAHSVCQSIDPDFDHDNDNYPPTAESLDYIQPHYRVMERLTP